MNDSKGINEPVSNSVVRHDTVPAIFSASMQ